MFDDMVTIRLETEDGFGMVVKSGIPLEVEWVQVSANAPMILTLAGRPVEGWDA